MRAIVLTGLSGSGKSTAIHILEDLGYYCIDNLPVPLLRPFVELSKSSGGGEIQKLALLIDARDQKNISTLPDTLKKITAEGHSLELIFITASDEVLARRFSETRRRHPLAGEGPVLEGIRKERKLLEPVHELATEILDTSDYTPKQLRGKLLKMFGQERARVSLTVEVVSFGFKYGLPSHADLVLDVRFLANPFFKEELRLKNGTDGAVQEYVLAQPDTKKLLEEYERLLKFLLPRFDREGKSYLTIAVGCTGGQHRSVVIAQEIRQWVLTQGYAATLTHRELVRE